MDTLTITLTNPRHIDGYIQAANGAGMTPEALALEFAEAQGERYANDFRIGIITGAAFIAKFTPAEYAGIVTYAASDVTTEVPELVSYVPTDDEQMEYELAREEYEALEDPTEEQTTLYLEVESKYKSLISQNNQKEIDTITAANEGPNTVKELINSLTSAPNVHLDNEKLRSGLELLVSLGLIEPERVNELLSYEHPQVGK